jgi:hypothetical protein
VTTIVHRTSILPEDSGTNLKEEEYAEGISESHRGI